ncbi:MAG: MarC family protein [Verrucomicrobia bacterium]|nr:MarC family protein [Verrucomicrobiota bacterium]
MIEYFLLALSTLFVIVDPLATVPVFLAMTPNDSPASRIRTARLAAIVTAAVLLTFALSGNLIFRLMGITLPAFQLAGSVILLLIAIDMLRAQPSRVRMTEEEADAGAAKEEIAITPLAVPMMAGPGAITTVIILRSQARSWVHLLILIGVILAVSASAYVTLRLSAYGARWLSPILMRLTTRIMGLLLAAIAVQFALNALGLPSKEDAPLLHGPGAGVSSTQAPSFRITLPRSSATPGRPPGPAPAP